MDGWMDGPGWMHPSIRPSRRRCQTRGDAHDYLLLTYLLTYWELAACLPVARTALIIRCVPPWSRTTRVVSGGSPLAGHLVNLIARSGKGGSSLSRLINAGDLVLLSCSRRQPAYRDSLYQTRVHRTPKIRVSHLGNHEQIGRLDTGGDMRGLGSEGGTMRCSGTARRGSSPARVDES